jgi:hypothetical protein
MAVQDTSHHQAGRDDPTRTMRSVAAPLPDVDDLRVPAGHCDAFDAVGSGLASMPAVH